jgi:C4-dicarboxylate transporter, DctM subunit
VLLPTKLIFLMLLGVALFSATLSLSRVPAGLSAAVAGVDLPPLVILGAILVIYFVLGCCRESMAMVRLTLPSFAPPMPGLGMGPRQVPVSVEVGMIPPPTGVNPSVVDAMAKDMPMGATCRGIAGFVASDIPRIALLALPPGLSLWLPGLW